MNGAIRVIIFGFALMIFGGVLLIANTSNSYLILLSYSFFIGFLLIIFGLIFLPNDKD